MKLLCDIRCGTYFGLLCGGMMVLGQASAESVANIESQVRLSQWLNATQNSLQPLQDKRFAPYWPGLVWMVPEEERAQGRMKSQLLEYIKAGNPATGVSRADATKLAAFVESLPVTGRVVVEKTDPRWLEVNPVHDPVLHKGQRILIPSRPSSVTVVRGDGHTCQVAHSVNSYAMDYVQKCDPARASGIAWIVQPDGLVQRRGVAGWNEDEQDPPAPGAWIVTDDPARPWPTKILEQLARLLATQGPARDQDASLILPQAPRQKNAITGQTDRPRGLKLATSLMQTPTARMGDAGELSFDASHVWPYTNLNMEVQPFDWVSVRFGWTDIANRLYGPTSLSGSQSYKDKSIDVKLKLSDESTFFPQVAVGLSDLGGTGLFASEYVVASKRTGNFDWSLGLGWGNLGARGNLGNPFSVFNPNFRTRQVGTAVTGQANTASWFTGPTALFGGVMYQTPWEPLQLKLELDGNDYQHEPLNNNLKQNSPINAGLVYRLSPAIDLSMSWQRGTTLGLGASFHDNLSKLFIPKISDPQPEIVSPVYPAEEPDWQKVAALLEEKTSWRVLQIRQAGSELIVRFERTDAMYWNAYIDRIASVLHRYAPSRSVMVFRIQSADYALGTHEYLIDRQAWVEAKTEFTPAHHVQNTVFEQPERQDFVYPTSDTLVNRAPKQFDGRLGIDYSQSLGGPDGFILYQIGVTATGNWYLQPNTWWTGTVARRVVDNYNKFKYTGPSLLPRVRTNIREYVTTSNVTMPTFQMTHVDKLNSENFYSVYGGMLESMFGGVGAEWLYRPWQSTVAFGVDVNEVRKRGFAQDFSFQNYNVLTGHASLYWEAQHDINVTLRLGRYLAGDIGATIDMSRVFRNGVKVGAFATKTNVSAAMFGEGSFDKGIYVDVPFDAFLIRSSPDVAHIQWHPLTRDGGAILNRQFPLAGLTGNQRGLTYKQSGNLLKWQPADSSRRTQFGDVPDSFSDGNDSVLAEAGHDMRALGRTAKTPDFWRSMLMIGGVSLASSVLDKPVDKLAVKHGAGGVMTRVENIGNFLPIAAAGYAGLMYLTSDEDSRLSRASYSSLAAGGMGFLGSTGLKYMVGRARPLAGQGSTSFTPISKKNSTSSWPSGHTTIMWATITPYAKAYDAPWLYGLAAATNVARIGGRNHWLSDTVAGAMLGYALGDFMWSQHKTQKHGVEWGVSPNGVTAYWKME